MLFLVRLELLRPPLLFDHLRRGTRLLSRLDGHNHAISSGDCQPLAYNTGTHWQDKCSSGWKLLKWNVTQLHLLHSEAESLRDGDGTGAGSNPVQGSGLASEVVPASRQMLADCG